MGSQKDVALGISGKLKSYVDFIAGDVWRSRMSLFQSVLLQEVVIEPNVMLECVPKFCYLGGHSWGGRRCGGGSRSQSEMCLG